MEVISNPKKGDIGNIFALYTPSSLDLNNLTSVVFVLIKPDDTTLTGLTGYADIDESYVYYRTQSGDLDQTGDYQYYATLTFETPYRLFHSDTIVKFVQDVP